MKRHKSVWASGQAENHPRSTRKPNWSAVDRVPESVVPGKNSATSIWRNWSQAGRKPCSLWEMSWKWWVNNWLNLSLPGKFCPPPPPPNSFYVSLLFIVLIFSFPFCSENIHICRITVVIFLFCLCFSICSPPPPPPPPLASLSCCCGFKLFFVSDHFALRVFWFIFSSFEGRFLLVDTTDLNFDAWHLRFFFFLKNKTINCFCLDNLSSPVCRSKWNKYTFTLN